MAPKVVMDTNVLVSGLRSRNGASFKMLSLVGSGKFSLCLSVPLVLEYEAATKKNLKSLGLTSSDVDSVIDYLCQVAEHHKVHYLWRPFLRDPKDDMVLELAVSANADFIATYNKVDFGGVGQFGIKVQSPREFLERIGDRP